MTVLIKSSKVDFTTMQSTRCMVGLDLMMKGSIQQDDTTIVNVHTSNNGTSKHMKQNLKELIGEIDNDSWSLQHSFPSKSIFKKLDTRSASAQET